MKKSKIFLVLMFAMSCMMLQSCWVTKTPVNDYYMHDGHVERYSKSKQFWLFEGFIPLGRTHTNTPPAGTPCLIQEQFTFGDVLVSGITFGLITARTIKCYVKVPVYNEYNRGDANQGTYNNNNNNITIQMGYSNMEQGSANQGTYANGNSVATRKNTETPVQQEYKTEVETESETPVQTQGSTAKRAPKADFAVGDRVMWKTVTKICKYGKIASMKDAQSCMVEDEKNKAKYIKKFADLTKVEEEPEHEF